MFRAISRASVHFLLLKYVYYVLTTVLNALLFFADILESEFLHKASGFHS